MAQLEGLTWEKTPEDAFRELYQSYTTTLFTAGARIAESQATEMQAWMKQNAPWTDRTGKARESLYAVAEQNARIVAQITIGYDTDIAPHGLWLEIAYAGRWGILPKTVDHFGPVFWKQMQNMMNLGLISR